MKKLFLTCAAVVGISAVFAANAFAAETNVTENDKGFDKETGTYSVAAELSDYTGQMTILIIPESIYTSNATIEDKDIYYIDQTAAPASGSKIFQSVGILGGTKLKEGTSYIVKIGGENIAESGIIVEKFTVAKSAPKYTLGDINGVDGVNIIDANLALQYCAELIQFNDTQLLAADVNGVDGVNIIDANLILQYCAELITKFPAEK